MCDQVEQTREARLLLREAAVQVRSKTPMRLAARVGERGQDAGLVTLE
jgi:hypothetical protein